MAKEIRYPTLEYIEGWVDEWLDKHPNEKVEDFKALEELARDAWWDNEVEHDRPTPFDLTKEQEKASKKARQTTSEKKGKKTTSYKFEKKTRPKDAEKVEIVQEIHVLLEKFFIEDGFSLKECKITNEGKEISFKIGENDYSLTLTKHRTPKKQGFCAKKSAAEPIFEKKIKKTIDK